MSTDKLVDFDEVLTRYEPVIGLETHVELGTASKMFCGCSTTFGAEPNTQTCPVCLGLPGALPVANAAAIEATIRIGLALGCRIATWCRFARKNYFYPDIPKGFQTSQYDEPLCTAGHLDVEVDGETYRVEIERVHLEEDTGKNLHVGGSTGRIHGADHSLIDYNRAGIPLVEIVTRPIPGAGAKAPEVARAYVDRAARDRAGARRLRGARWSRATCAATSTSPSRRSAASSGAPAARPRTSTRCARSSGPCATRCAGRPPSSTRAGGSCRRPGTSTRTPAARRRAGARRRRPTTGTSPSPTWCRSPRTRSGSRSSPRRCPSCPPPVARGCRRSGASRPTEMAWLVNAGAVDLVGDTVAAGASPADARKWWLGELARRANDAGVELADLAVTPAQVAELVALVAAGTINDQLARQTLDGVLAGEGDPAQVVEARGLAVMGESDELVAAVDAAIEGEPRRRREGPRRQGAGHRCAGRRGHEDHPRQGRRRDRQADAGRDCLRASIPRAARRDGRLSAAAAGWPRCDPDGRSVIARSGGPLSACGPAEPRGES